MSNWAHKKRDMVLVMNWKNHFFFGLLFLFVSPLYAQDKSEALSTLLKMAGANAVIEEFVEEIALEQAKARIIASGEEGLSDMEKSLYLASFNVKEMNNSLHHSFMQALTLDEIKGLMAFFDRPVVKKMLAADRLNGLSDGTISSKQYLRSILNNPPSKQRIALMRELVDVSLYVEQQVYLNGLITLEKNKVPKEYHGAYGEEEAQQLEYYVESYKQNMADLLKPEMRLTFMRVYESLSDDEIARLIQLMTSQERLRYQSVLVDGLAEVMSEGIRRGIIAVLAHRAERSS